MNNFIINLFKKYVFRINERKKENLYHIFFEVSRKKIEFEQNQAQGITGKYCNLKKGL